MDKSTERKVKKAVELYFSGYSARDAIQKVNLDSDELYDTDTGKTICEIDVATDEQIERLLEGRIRSKQ